MQLTSEIDRARIRSTADNGVIILENSSLYGFSDWLGQGSIEELEENLRNFKLMIHKNLDKKRDEFIEEILRKAGNKLAAEEIRKAIIDHLERAKVLHSYLPTIFTDETMDKKSGTNLRVFL